MAASSLYRFRLDVSDVDRGFYESLDFRLAMHPSESFPYLLTRVLAYALRFEEGLEISAGGLSDTDAPAFSTPDPSFGGLKTWIEIGSPSARRLHKATKAAKHVLIFTYKNPAALIQEIRGNDVHRAEEIEIYSFGDEFLSELEGFLERDNKWSVLYSEGTLTVGAGEHTASGELGRHSL